MAHLLSVRLAAKVSKRISNPSTVLRTGIEQGMSNDEVDSCLCRNDLKEYRNTKRFDKLTILSKSRDKFECPEYKI